MEVCRATETPAILMLAVEVLKRMLKIFESEQMVQSINEFLYLMAYAISDVLACHKERGTPDRHCPLH